MFVALEKAFMSDAVTHMAFGQHVSKHPQLHRHSGKLQLHCVPSTLHTLRLFGGMV
jgi:hypothetical protein